MKLNRLEIEGLRGIPRGWPPIPVSDRGLVIYGPNASGKSSVIDGIEFALQKESSLYAETRQGVNWERGSQHIKGGPKRAELHGRHQGKEYNLTTLVGAPEEVVAWKRSAATATFVLRRHMLLKFIMSQPADRYGSLESFFNLQAYGALEARLLGLLNSARTVENGLEVTVTSKAQTLRAALGLGASDAVNETTAQAKLTEALTAASFPPAHSAEEREQRKSEAKSELEGLAADARLSELSALRSHISELVPSSTYDAMLGQLAQLQQDLQQAKDESVAKAPADFLRAAKSLISEGKMTECPVCEQGIDSDATVASLIARISSDVRVTTAQAAVDNHRQSILTPISLHASAFRRLLALWEKACGEKLPKSYEDELQLLDEVVQRLRSGEFGDSLVELRAALKATIATHQPLLETINAEITSAGGTRRAALCKILEVIDVLQSQVAALSSARKHLKASSETRALLERVHGHALQARRATVQKIVERLATLANDYYEFIHPGEKISSSALEVRQVGKGSVEISTTFHGQKEHPLLHFSESHLDTLGLCYFLAARRLEAQDNNGFRLLVLDDVVHSVDSDHRERIARLLKEKFADHQLVIVTHDSVFYQRLRANLGNQFEYLYFTNWSLEGGPVRMQGSTDIDRVTNPELRNTKPPEELAAAAGRFAEWLLMQLTERLQVAVPARFSRPHDIGNLWPALAAKLKKHKFFGPLRSAIVEKVDGSQWVRNKVGAHYNEPESPVTPAEVRQFAESLSELHDATICQSCSTSIMKVDDSNWRCDCGRLQYGPPISPESNDNQTVA